MFLFYRLLLAHLLADFPLQFSKLFRLKTEGIKGVILHGSVFGILAVIFSAPYLAFSNIGIFLIFLWVFHIFTDWLKIKLIHHYKNDSISLFVFDQMLHIAAIAAVILFNFPPAAGGHSFLSRLYSNDSMVIFCIFYVITTFAATVVIYYLKKTYVHSDISFPMKGRYYDIIERALITTFIILPGYFYLFAPLFIAGKAIICRKKNFQEGDYDFSMFNFTASFSIAVIVGIILRLMIY